MPDGKMHPVDPAEFRESASSVTDKLMRLVLSMMIVALPVAFLSLMGPNPQFSWTDCLIAAVFGSIVMSRFARQEDLPILFGAVSGLISGAGIHFATIALLLQVGFVSRRVVYFVGLLGSLPGLAVFYLLVRLYYPVLYSLELEETEAPVDARE